MLYSIPYLKLKNIFDALPHTKFMQKIKKKSFALNATFLAVGGLLCKVIGAVYRIPLVKILSTSGIGLYQTAFPVFAILLTLSSGGISQAISALLASEGRENTTSVVRAGFSVVSSATIITSLLLYFLAPVLSNIQGTPNATGCYRALVPAIIFSGFSAVIKGYFQAQSNVTPTIISQIIEQTAKLVFGLILSNLFITRSTTDGVIGALLGVSISELLCFFFLFIRYVLRKDKEPPSYIPKNYAFIRVFRASLPLALGGIVLPISSLIDSVTVVNILSTTNSLNYATSMYGIQTGVVNTITNLPAVFTVALGVTIVPVMCNNSGTRVLKKGRISVKLAMLVCIPSTILLSILAPNVIDLLYPSMSITERNVASVCLSISAIGIAPLGLTQIYSSLLFSVGLVRKSIKNLIIGVVVKCLVLFPLVNNFGIYGASVSTVLCYLTSAILNARTWLVLDENHPKTKSFGKLFISSVICSLPVFLLKSFLSTSILFALTLLCVVLYLYTVTKTRALTPDEVESIPFLRPFTKVK